MITTKPKSNKYGIIQRGTSLTIPVTVKDMKNAAIDLTDSRILFTVKAVKSDFDRNDTRAYITKNFFPQEPELGSFRIELTSADTDFETGTYFFDIEVVTLTGAVYRLSTLEFQLEGGPTNRGVNDGTGQLAVGDEINIISLEFGQPITVISSPVVVSSELFLKVDKMELKIADYAAKLDVLEKSFADTVAPFEETLKTVVEHEITIKALIEALKQAQKDIVDLTARIDKM